MGFVSEMNFLSVEQIFVFVINMKPKLFKNVLALARFSFPYFNYFIF